MYMFIISAFHFLQTFGGTNITDNATMKNCFDPNHVQVVMQAASKAPMTLKSIIINKIYTAGVMCSMHNTS